jgi:EAL domain-containing protein (putative c-di-GMP-specific phosphodiesterase class I)
VSWPALLESATRPGVLTPVFQPIVDLARGVVCGYEGLARFAGPPNAGPQEWFAAAAMYGYSGRLEALALRAMLSRRQDMPVNCFLSVNLSPDALLAPEVAEVLSTAGDLSGLVFEVTEQTPVEDYEAVTALLDRLRKAGAMVAVDDTGAGYASLSHLLSLRPHFVKVDRSLITGVDGDPRRAAAVAAIGAFAGQLDAWVVAEGIEHTGELDRLMDLGVPMAQGYLLGRPSSEMSGLSVALAARILERNRLRNTGDLSTLARPVTAARTAPDIASETVVLVDSHGRPTGVIVADRDGRRTRRHPAMCVQAAENLNDLAMRVVGRPSRDRYAPVCLCDGLGKAVGLITVDRLLVALAARAER